MDFNHIYGAGFRHGQVKTAAAIVFDIDAIIGIEGEPEQDETQIPGDDTVKATFSSGRREKLTITANAISMDVLAAITGNTITAIGTGPQTGATIPIGTQLELNPPFVEIAGIINGKTDTGINVTVKKTWHRVQLNNVKITSSNGSEMSVEMSGTAIQASKDIADLALAPARVATLEISTGSL